jgi:hypothetical protein
VRKGSKVRLSPLRLAEWFWKKKLPRQAEIAEKLKTRPGDSDIKEELNELRETLSLRGREVDSLQVELTNQRNLRKKWYQDPAILISTLISISALIVSFVVPIYAMRTAKNSSFDDLQFQKETQLTTVVLRLSEIREKIAEHQLEYDAKVPIPSVGSRTVLIEEAIKLSRLVSADSFSFQRMIIAESLNDTNQPDRAGSIAEEAESAAKNRLEKILAAQMLAVAYFNQGKHEKGRQAYSRALAAAEVMDPAGSVDPLVKALYQLDTEQLWISSELRINNCHGAKERLLKLELNGALFPRSLADESERRVGLTRTNVAKICP